MVTYDVFIDAAHAAMPSNYYEELRFNRTTGNNFYDSYIAPSDGFVCITCASANESTNYAICAIMYKNIVFRTASSPGSDGGNARSFYTFLPVSEGQEVRYTANYVSSCRAFFVYCNGSVPANPNP